MEVTLMLILLNPKYYQNEIWSNASVSCVTNISNMLFGSVLETGS